MYKMTSYHCRICGNVNEKCAPCFQYPEYEERCSQKPNARGTYFRLCSKHFEPRLWRQQSDQKFYLTDDNANPMTLVDRKILANLLLPIIRPKIMQQGEYYNRAYVFPNYATKKEFLVKPFKIKISRCDFMNYQSNEVLMEMPQKVISTVNSNTAELLKEQHEVKSIQICLANYKDLREKLKYKVISNDKFVEAPNEEKLSLPEVQVKVVRIEMSRLEELSKCESKESAEWRRTHVVSGSKSKSYPKFANRNTYWKVQFRTSLSANDASTLENGKDVAVPKKKKTSQEKRTHATDYESQNTVQMVQGSVDLVNKEDENHKTQEVALSKSMFVIVDDWIKVAAKMPQLENTGINEERILTHEGSL